FFFFQAEDGIRDKLVTGVQTCALPIWEVSRAVPRVDLRRAYLGGGLPYRFRDWDLPFISWLSRTGKQADWFSDDDFAGIRSGDEIGRASCRERVQRRAGEGALQAGTVR